MLNQQPNQSTAPESEPKTTKPSKPNEQGSFSLDAHVKIYDPKTREVYVEGRA